MPAKADLESGTCWNRYTPACGWLTVFSSAAKNLPEYGSSVPENRDALGPLIAPHSLQPFGMPTAIHRRRTRPSPRPLLNQARARGNPNWDGRVFCPPSRHSRGQSNGTGGSTPILLRPCELPRISLNATRKSWLEGSGL